MLGLALLECGADSDDEDVIKVAKMVRASVYGDPDSKVPPMNNPYDIAPSIWFLDRLNKTPEEDDLKMIRSLGYRLLAGQRRAIYLWRYNVPTLTNPGEEEELIKNVDLKMTPLSTAYPEM